MCYNNDNSNQKHVLVYDNCYKHPLMDMDDGVLELWRHWACPRVGDRRVIALSFCPVTWFEGRQPSHTIIWLGCCGRVGAMPSHLTTSQLEICSEYNSIHQKIFVSNGPKLFGASDRRGSKSESNVTSLSMIQWMLCTLPLSLCLSMSVSV